jgi:hypothetical protein
MVQRPENVTDPAEVAPFSILEPNVAASIRDSVARELFGVTYSELSADFQADLGTLELDAANEVTRLAQWYMLTDPSWANTETNPADPEAYTEFPQVFNELFRVAWLARAYRRFRSPEVGAIFRTQHVLPIYQQLSSTFDPNFATASLLAGDEVTYNSLCRSVISRLIRQRTPVIPPFHEAQRTIRDEYVKLWKSKRWTWRIRFKQVTLTTAGEIEFPLGDNDRFDGFASKHINIRSSTGQRYKVRWLDSTRFVEAAAYFYDDDGVLQTGMPEYFYDEDHGDSQVLKFLPAPDQAYTGYANVIIGPPLVSDDTNDASNLAALPYAFRAHLRDRIFATLLSEWGKEDVDATRAIRNVEKDYSSLTSAWEDRGAQTYSARGHAAQRWVQRLQSYGGDKIIGQHG